MSVQITKYDLSGGSSVEVHKVFGDSYYIALVDLKGEYPEHGQEAIDIGRAEHVVVTSGELTIYHNDKKHELKEGESITFEDGDHYRISGIGRCVVFVHDQENGRTETVDIKRVA